MLDMKATTKTGKNMERGTSTEVMAPTLLVRFKIIRSMEMGYILGPMIDSMRGVGCRIRWRAMGCSSGAMAGDMREIIRWIKNMGLVFLPGLTGVSTRDYGSMENNTVRGNILVAMV